MSPNGLLFSIVLLVIALVLLVFGVRRQVRKAALRRNKKVPPNGRPPKAHYVPASAPSQQLRL